MTLHTTSYYLLFIRSNRQPLRPTTAPTPSKTTEPAIIHRTILARRNPTMSTILILAAATHLYTLYLAVTATIADMVLTPPPSHKLITILSQLHTFASILPVRVNNAPPTSLKCHILARDAKSHRHRSFKPCTPSEMALGGMQCAVM
ncbi:hypothetical protein BDW02DRAFT_567875 [Decorospora gaudefroyi]|uniref:Uncharacterized protein n=1 Tax=Decorospora gaudefroyi TaxID=184978 RepID=A0A6A5KHZ3_9PLEO|nr:hypothetical protein BDW02DRAFT_567875 [Decorospora gaudefroyi]